MFKEVGEGDVSVEVTYGSQLNSKRGTIGDKKHSKQKELHMQRPWGRHRMERGRLRELNLTAYSQHLSLGLDPGPTS